MREKDDAIAAYFSGFKLYRRGERWHCTVRSARAPGDVPLFVTIVIRHWVYGQSKRWIAQRYGIDQGTVRRWIEKHPDVVRRFHDELGHYRAPNAYELRRKREALRALGIAV